MGIDDELESDDMRHAKNILDCNYTGRFAKSDLRGGTLCTYLNTYPCRHREEKIEDDEKIQVCKKWRKKIPYDADW